jgi:hypothetical protein
MRTGQRAGTAVAALAAVATLGTACGDVHADGRAGAAPLPAASAALRSATADRCPARPAARPVSDAAGVRDRLEPLTAARVLLCGYGAPGGRSGAMAPAGAVSAGAPTGHALVTDPAVVATLRSRFNALGPVPRGRFSCPNADGSVVIAVFTDGVQEVQLRDEVSGCATVTNGSLTRWVGSSGVNDTVLALLRHTTRSG